MKARESVIKAYHGTLNEFDRFDLSFSTDIGHHFGSPAQARARLSRIDDGSGWIILECLINLQKPITGLIDIDDWADHQALAWSILQTQKDPQLLEIGRQYRHEPYRFLGEQPIAEMKEKIQALGYDGIVYSNDGEGGRESYMVFEDKQIEIVRR